MTLAAPLENSRQKNLGIRTSSIPRRAAIVGSLMLADLICFALADLALRGFEASPGLALFRGRYTASPTTIDLIIVIAVAFVAIRYVAGDYSRRQLFWDSARATTTGLLICGILCSVAVIGLLPWAVGPTLLVWIALIFLVPSTRQLMRLMLCALGLWNLPTTIIGTSKTAQDVCRALGKQLSLGLDVRWLIPETGETKLPTSLGQLRVLTLAPDEIVENLVKVGCCQVIWVPDERLRLEGNDLIDQLIGADISVAIVPPLRRLPLFGLSTSSFFGKDLLLLQVRDNLARLPQRILKRSLDIVGSLLLIALLSPLFAVLAVIIKRQDGGPILFSQYRVGRNGYGFRCWKFRTMVTNAEAVLRQWAKDNPQLHSEYLKTYKLRDDPRITPIGKWLRKTSLDELPQLWNVVCGEMSLVGPRPVVQRELEVYYGPAARLYIRTRPGMTGVWQVSGRSDTTFAERVAYDEWYIKNWTVWYDVVILLQTLWVLIAREGAY